MRRNLGIALIVCVAGSTLMAQEAAEPASPPDPTVAPTPVVPKAIKHRVHLTDGSILTGVLEQGTLVVETAYGRLTVPADHIERIVPGLDRRTELRKKVMRYVKDLGSDVFAEREKAEQALLTLGPRVLTLLKAQPIDDDIERAKRMKVVIDQLEEIALEQEDDFESNGGGDVLIAQDQVIAKHFKIIGRVESQHVPIATAYGKLSIDLSKIERVELARPMQAVQQARVEVTGSHMAMMGHLKTKIRLKRGDKVTIRATGKITLTPWGTQAFSLPDGMTNYGWYLPNQIPMGALVGRIGGNGQVFMVGSKKSFVAEKSGILELAFAMQPSYATSQFPGEYKVRIHVEPK